MTMSVDAIYFIKVYLQESKSVYITCREVLETCHFILSQSNKFQAWEIRNSFQMVFFREAGVFTAFKQGCTFFVKLCSCVLRIGKREIRAIKDVSFPAK